MCGFIHLVSYIKKKVIEENWMKNFFFFLKTNYTSLVSLVFFWPVGAWSRVKAVCNKTAAEFFYRGKWESGPTQRPLGPNSARLLVSAQALLTESVSLGRQRNVTAWLLG